ncbi:unnamed protein product [Rhodiola kirilowii]
MKKQKQQVISRFFAPKSESHTPTSPSSHHKPQTPPPKISTTVTFSPSRRILNSQEPRLPTHSLHRKFLDKLLEPSDSSIQTSEKSQKLTPLESQVVELKKKFPDVLLMIEVGYRLVNAGYKVGVVKQTETAAIKSHGDNKLGPFTRGLSALYTRATLEAVEDIGGGEEGCGSSSNYLVCVVEEKANFENSKGGNDVKIGIVAVETSTGDVVHGEFDDGFMRSRLEAVLLSLAPAELILGDPLSKETQKLLKSYAGTTSKSRIEYASRECFQDGGALAEVMSLYEKVAEECQHGESMAVVELGNNQVAVEGIMSMAGLAVQALALTIRYLKQFGLERILCMGSSFRTLSNNVEMTLSANTLQQLEILKNNSDGSESGSLLQIMDHTLSVPGSRLMRHWVAHPLSDRNSITARLDAVSEIAECLGTSKTLQIVDLGCSVNSDIVISHPKISDVLSSILTLLGRIPDIQRGITRVFHGTATPSEFISVMQAILHAAKQLQQLDIREDCIDSNRQADTVQSTLLRKLVHLASSPSIIENATKFLSALNQEAADRKDVSHLFVTSSGQFPEIFQAQDSVLVVTEKLESLIISYQKKFGMHNLEYISVSGSTHLIELPVGTRVPFDWVKINSTKKTIRYHPPEVTTLLDELTLKTEELAIACRAAWDIFLKKFGKHYAEFQAAVQALASLDCLYSLAILSRHKNYTRPNFVGDCEPVQICIHSGRHPVLDNTLQDSFVPNDTNLYAEGECCQVVTGPNMGGKSCYIRQVALLAIMAQVGSYVPASSMKLHVLDSIHTRMGASDNIHLGRSTFLEEVSEASHILKQCTEKSLVIIDELGRGTSTHDGVAIAYAALHYLLEQKKCMVLFVTHYPSIIEIRNRFQGSVGAYHVSYMTTDTHNHMDQPDNPNGESVLTEDVTYLYKLAPGISERSFGFKVAQLAQIPTSCIERAITKADELASVISSRVESRSSKRRLIEAPLTDENLKSEKNVSKRTRVLYSQRKDSIENLTDNFREIFASLNTILLGGGDTTDTVNNHPALMVGYLGAIKLPRISFGMSLYIMVDVVEFSSFVVFQRHEINDVVCAFECTAVPVSRVIDLLRKCNFKQLRQIHALILTSSLIHQTPISSAFLRRSSELGEMDYAGIIFSQLGSVENRDVTIWNAMIRGYAFNGPFEKCLSLFDEMTQRQLRPNNFTYPFVINCLSQTGHFDKAKQVHCRVVKSGFQSNYAVSTSLFDMYLKMEDGLSDARKVFDEMCSRPVELWNRMMSEYGKIAQVESAKRLFETMPEKDVVSWNTLISAYAGLKDCGECEELVPENAGEECGVMGFLQTVFTFVSVLTACAHLGNLQVGKWIHYLLGDGVQFGVEVRTALMEITFGIHPILNIWVLCDLLCRNGLVEEALSIVENMPHEPDIPIWGALLGGCKLRNDFNLAEKVLACANNLKVNKSGLYILLSNMHAAADHWSEALLARKEMENSKILKEIGVSSLI